MKSMRESSLKFMIWLSLLSTAPLALTSCSKSNDSSDLGDAALLSDKQVDTLNDFFSGKSEANSNRAADVASMNLQTILLISILAVAILILIAVLVKNKKKKDN